MKCLNHNASTLKPLFKLDFYIGRDKIDSAITSDSEKRDISSHFVYLFRIYNIHK